MTNRFLMSFIDPHEKKQELMIEITRQRKLDEAAMKGSVPSLLRLFHEDPHIVTSFSTPLPSSSFADTPLHVAALLGHLHFAREILTRNPNLAGALDSGGSTPLHLASAKGYVEIVKELLLVGSDACFVLDREGRSPVHLAAIKGRVGVLTELVRVRPEAARVLSGGGESCLHMCVKYNRLEALKVLIEFLKNDDRLVNWKDGEGNTILHLAVAKKQIEIIKYLLAATPIEVSSRNANGLTAMDVLSQSPRDLRDMEIKECLQGGGLVTRLKFPVYNETEEVSLISDQKNSRNDSIITKEQPKKHKHTDWLGRKRSALMVVASLIATVAFQAAISPPGGVWQNDYLVDSNGNPITENPHEAGKSVMAFNIPQAYGQFMIFDTIAFLASLSIILLQISGLPLKRRRWMWSQMVTMWIAITAQTITYFITLVHMTPKHIEGTLYQVTKISMLGWMSLMAVVFVGNVVRVILWMLRKHGYIKEKVEEVPTLGEDDE